MPQRKKVAVAITGASGAIYAHVLLTQLQQQQNQVAEMGIVWSSQAKTVWETELPDIPLPTQFTEWNNNDFSAPIASGSANYDVLIICPCSMGTLGRIAHGISDNLITRAADVALKERKKLILLARETPYNTIQLQNMLNISQAGGIICPASPSFYSLPQDITQLAATVTTRALQLAGLDIPAFAWGSTNH